MKIAFIVDPLDHLKPYKDTSIAMMREAQHRGHQVFTILREALVWRDGVVAADSLRIELLQSNQVWYAPQERAHTALDHFDAVLMRQDPPFDFEYVAATWLLERAVNAGVRVYNDPRAIRDHSEKLAITEFPDLAPPTLVGRDPKAINAFIDEMEDVVLKPLDGMGGSSIFRVRGGDPNRNVIIETLTSYGRRTIMAQRHIPEIALGDKRILLIGGEAVPYCLARIPRPGETRGNLAAGGTGVARPLTDRDRKIAEALALKLHERGLILVGIDVIGDYLTEVNVTSPTCFVEITEQTGFNVAGRFLDALEQAVREGP
jgi:glutathione synthase